MQVTNNKGRQFNIRILKQGDKYGLNNCLTWKEEAMGVEIYDATHKHTEFGQFISQYYAKTLINSDSANGIDLDGGVPAWKIDGDNWQTVIQWLKTIEVTQ